MKHLWILVVFLQTGFLFPTPLTAQDSLRHVLEDSILKVHRAINEGDRKAFRSSIDSHKPHPAVTPGHWTQVIRNDLARKVILRAVPDLKISTKFLKVKVEGNLAGYYAEGSLDDANYQSLDVCKETGLWPCVKSRSVRGAQVRCSMCEKSAPLPHCHSNGPGVPCCSASRGS